MDIFDRPPRARRGTELLLLHLALTSKPGPTGRERLREAVGPRLAALLVTGTVHRGERRRDRALVA